MQNCFTFLCTHFFFSIFKVDYRKIKSFNKVSFEFDHYLSYLSSFICSKKIDTDDNVNTHCSYSFWFNYWRYSCLEIIPRNMWKLNIHTVFPHICSCRGNYSFLNSSSEKLFKFSFPLFNENLNSFLTRWGNYWRRGNYSREETIWGNTVSWF